MILVRAQAALDREGPAAQPLTSDGTEDPTTDALTADELLLDDMAPTNDVTATVGSKVELLCETIHEKYDIVIWNRNDSDDFVAQKQKVQDLVGLYISN